MKFADTPSSADVRQFIDSTRWVVKKSWASHPSLILGIGLVTLARALFPAASAIVIRSLINVAVEASGNQFSTLTPLLPWLVLGFGLTAAEAISALLFRFLMNRFADDANLNISSDILQHASRLDVAFFDDPRFQNIIHRAQQNTAGHYASFLSSTLTFTTLFVQIISLIAVLATIEPIAIPVLIPFALPHFLFQLRLSRKHYLTIHGHATKRRLSGYFVSLLTSRATVPEVRLLGLAPVLINKFRSLMKQFRDQNRKRYFKGFLGDSLFATLTTVVFYLMFARTFHRFLQGALPIGDVVIFGTVGLRLRGALESVVTSMSRAMEHALYISNLQAFLSIKPQTSFKKGMRLKKSTGEVVFRDVSFTYPGSKKPALSNVSFHILPGETVAVVGKNGSGKTTLIKLALRFYDPSAGSIQYDRIDLKQLSIIHFHRQVAFVPQSFARYEATALDNIAYGDWKRLLHDREQTKLIARYAGVDHMIEKLPHSYDTILGRKFGEHDLSGGQWQQIAIARALSRDSALLILDEPTSNLDALAEYKLFNRFRKLAEGRTTILISHRFSSVKMADRIIVLDKGRIVESGTHSELVSNGGYYATLYNIQKAQMVFSEDGSS